MSSQIPPTQPEASAPAPADIAEQLDAALSIDDEFSRVQELMLLAPHLSSDLFPRVFKHASDIRNEHLRAKLLVELAQWAGSAQVNAAYNLIGNISAANGIEALGRIYPLVDASTQYKIRSQIASNTDQNLRLKGWLGMGESLPPENRKEAIKSALSLTNEEERAMALTALAPLVPDVTKIQFLKSAREIKNPEVRVRALCGLLPAMPKKEQPNVLDEALSLARELTSPQIKAESLLQLLPQVPAELQSEVSRELVLAANEIENLQERVRVLLDFSSRLPAGYQQLGFLKNLLIADLADITDEKELGEAWILLAQLGPPQLLSSILEQAKKIKDSRVRQRVIIQVQNLMEARPARLEDEYADVDPGPAGDDGSAIGAGAASGPWSGEMQEAVGAPDTEGDAPPDFEEAGADASDFAPPPSDADDAANPPWDADTDASPEKAPAREPAISPPTDSSTDKPTRRTRKKATKVTSPTASPVLEPDPPGESVGVKAYLHSDSWTLDDQLNYSLYAEAIAEFIRHGDTKPPLAIGILAPWGQGKTTLMKLIQYQLKKKAEAPEAPLPPAAPIPLVTGGGAPPTGVVAPPITPSVNFAYLRKWLQNPTRYKPEIPKLNYPTVWFNAWKYQNSEQLWAGMAYCILSQLVEQMNNQFEREKFWLALQAERVDFNAIRRDIHRVVFERIAPWLAIWIAVGFVGLVFCLVGILAGNVALGSGGGAALALGGVMPVVQWLRAKTKTDSKPLEGKFAQYVRQPTYEGKLGFFHEIETDVQRVFKLLVAEGKPVVVFIDDLDRCAPGTVAQVIEAMNLFLSADFPDCYFVVGMDAQVVAASMEVAYDNLDKKLKSVTRSYGSLGWYFMDKFIQLQFNIPNMTPDQRSTYLTKLFGQERLTKEVVSDEGLDKVQKGLEEKLQDKTLKADELPKQAAELAKLRQSRPKVWQQLSHTLITTGAKQLSDDSPVLQKYLERYEPYLGVSPRGIKRFANLYRFYSLSQLSRQSQGLPACSPSALARWLVIMLRWPQVVRWIQWEGEAKLTAGTGSFQKAKDLEDELRKTKTHEAWLKYLDKLDNQMEWLRDKQLYDFLKIPTRTDEELSSAVKTGVW